MRAPNSPTPTHMHIQNRGAQHCLQRVFQQSQKNPSCSRVFCLIRQYKFHINFLNGFLIYQEARLPRKEHTMLVAADVPPKSIIQRQSPSVNQKVAVTGQFQGRSVTALGFSSSAQASHSCIPSDSTCPEPTYHQGFWFSGGQKAGRKHSGKNLPSLPRWPSTETMGHCDRETLEHKTQLHCHQKPK